MINEVFMPALSSTMTEGKIVAWVKSPGDKVEKGETVVVVESDKADMDVESFYEGYLAVITVPAGEMAPVGAAIALVAETEAEIATAQKQTNTSAQPSTPAAPAPVATPQPVAAVVETASVETASVETASVETASVETASVETASVETASVETASTNGASQQNGRLVASPRARKLAKDLKIDLATLRGSGPHGRIVAEDVEAAAGRTPATPTATPSPVAPLSTPVATPAVAAPPRPTPAVPTAPITPGQQVPLTTLQNAVVRNMMVSLEVPTFHVGYTITTDNLDKLYKQIKSKGVTMTALLAKAIAVTLQKHPLVNASFANQSINHPAAINVAVAVAMDDGGLITPVLQSADKMDIYSLSRTWKDLVDRARAKQLQPDEYSTGTIAISNLGMFGVDRFDAILPPGMGAILAIGASRPTVVATDDGLLGVKRQMQVNITCDHRVIYGAHAAAFLKDLATLIETNAQSLTL